MNISSHAFGNGKRVSRFFVALVFTLLLYMPVSTSAAGYTRPEELVEKSAIVLKSFMSDPQMEWFRQHVGQAKGVFIIPQLIKGGFMIGGAGGSGVLLAFDPQKGWSYPAFYTMGSISFGLQIGGEASEIILMIMTEKGIDSFLSTSLKLGADISIAAGPVGAGAKAQIADILAFARSKGAFAGVSIEGAVIKYRDSWNQQYYRRPVRAVDILVKRNVANRHADGLRRMLSRIKQAK